MNFQTNSTKDASKLAFLRAKSKNFLGRGHSRSPKPVSIGDGSVVQTVIGPNGQWSQRSVVQRVRVSVRGRMLAYIQRNPEIAYKYAIYMQVRYLHACMEFPSSLFYTVPTSATTTVGPLTLRTSDQ